MDIKPTPRPKPGINVRKQKVANRGANRRPARSAKNKIWKVIGNTNYPEQVMFVLAETEIEAVSKYTNRTGFIPDKVEAAHGARYNVVWVIRETKETVEAEVHAGSPEHAVELSRPKVPADAISSKKVPYVHKEHLTYRPFGNLKDLIKEKA